MSSSAKRTSARRRLHLHDDGNDDDAPAAAPVVDLSGDSDEDVDPSPAAAATAAAVVTPKKKKKGIQSFFTPPKKQQRDKKRPAEVTPGLDDAGHKKKAARRIGLEVDEYQSDDQDNEEEEFVPVHIHANVDYKRRGVATLPSATLKAYRHIRDRYVVPKDFEKRPEYGPLSGTNFEERVIGAYERKKLVAKELEGSEENQEWKICSYCGDLGHLRRRCPNLL